jgi:hypothetical protein
LGLLLLPLYSLSDRKQDCTLLSMVVVVVEMALVVEIMVVRTAVFMMTEES